MKETTKICPRKFVAKMKDILICRLAGQTTERKAIDTTSPQSNLSTGQKKANHPALRLAAKSKKRRIPFIALALVLVFSSLCVFPLLVQLPFAQAREALSSSVKLQHSNSAHLDNPSPVPSPSADCVETNTCNITGSQVGSKLTSGDVIIAEKQPCTNFKNFDSNSSLSTLCSTDEYFFYANRDITCVANPNIRQQYSNLLTDRPFLGSPLTSSSSSPSDSSTPTPSAGPTSSPSTDGNIGLGLRNENTCTQNVNNDVSCGLSDSTCSMCYSDNATGRDNLDNIVHDESVGGDDVFCLNVACEVSSTSGNSDVCGTGQVYSKSACSPWPGSDNHMFYNPTAYQPGYAVEVGTALFTDAGPGSSLWGQVAQNLTFGALHLPNTTNAAFPICINGQWTCNNGMNIVMILDNGMNIIMQLSHTSPFTGSPKEINNIALDKQHPHPYPPEYDISCTSSGDGLKFPCSDTPTNTDPHHPQAVTGSTVDAVKIQKDWLSGDGASGNLGDNIASNDAAAGKYPAGHLTTTYNEDTVSSQLLQKLFGIMEAVGFLLITPIAILIGYHLLWASWTYRSVAIMESLGRLVLGIMAIGISYQLVTMLIGLVNLFNHGVIMLHIELPYSAINASTLPGGANGYTLYGDNDVASFRGVVQPITRWGCTINIFLGILTSKFATDVVGAVTPFVGGMVQLFGRIQDASEILKNIGNFMMLLFSINLCVQIFVRIIFLNYYIVTAPVIFACWAMPGGTGVKIMGQWTKGILSILFTQTVQLFVLTTMPLLVPAFPPLPGGAWGILNVFFNQLPPVLVLMATIQVPKLMGTGATKATAQAGTLAAGAVAAMGAAAYNIV